jgi:hypothetical protein
MLKPAHQEPQMPNSSQPARRGGIFIALVPWVIFSFLASHDFVKPAVVLALIAAAAIAAPGVRAGRAKILEVGALVAFAGIAAVTFADPAASDFIARYGRGIAAGLMSVIAFGSLLFTPFTEQYAREAVPARLWNSPQFKAANRQLTALWATVFAAMVPLHIIAGSIDTRRSNLIFNWVLPVLLVMWAAKRSSAEATGAAVEVHA